MKGFRLPLLVGALCCAACVTTKKNYTESYSVDVSKAYAPAGHAAERVELTDEQLYDKGYVRIGSIRLEKKGHDSQGFIREILETAGKKGADVATIKDSAFSGTAEKTTTIPVERSASVTSTYVEKKTVFVGLVSVSAILWRRDPEASRAQRAENEAAAKHEGALVLAKMQLLDACGDAGRLEAFLGTEAGKLLGPQDFSLALRTTIATASAGTVALLGRAGARPDSATLVSAVKAGNAGAVGGLLDLGADRNVIEKTRPGDDGLSLPQLAAKFGNREMLLELRARKFELIASPGTESRAPLGQATAAGKEDAVEFLLSVETDSARPAVASALLSKATEKSASLVRIFLKAGASPTSAPRAVGNCAGFGSPEALSMLLQAGADPNGVVDGLSALHWAAKQGKFENAKLLLAAGANPNAKSDQGDTPLDLATRGGYVELSNELRARGGTVKSSGR